MKISEYDKLYYRDELRDAAMGAVWSAERTLFRVWSPAADDIKVNLYRDGAEPRPFSVMPMTADRGLWGCAADGDLSGVYYTYSVAVNGKTRETIDIYARSSSANGKRGLIIGGCADPDGFDKTKPVKLASKTDAVICELHVRDFSMDKNADFEHRGKLLAFCESGVTNKYGDTVGLDYIASLGVTHIHLLPVFDFASVDETDKKPRYNWGYDPFNLNAPEGSYSTDARDGYSRVRELKQLIMAAHERGLGVIMDVVYNHVYDAERSPFNIICPGYYFRHDKRGGYSNGSGCGNEFASERMMARKFICDSLCGWLKDYKLDGFRFDLMGLLDIKTLELCAKRLRRINPSVLLYGEGWTGGASPLSERRRAVRANMARLPAYSMFSDEFRDCVKGSVFSDTDCGYINGNAAYRAESMKSAMIGGVYHQQLSRPREGCLTDDPAQAINYTECHDNLTFFDKLTLSMPDASERERIAADKLGAVLIFLAQGVPFIQAGQELLRSKPDGRGGFEHDSYKSPDRVNSIKWNDVHRRRDVLDYYRGLIAVRRSADVFRMRSADELRRRISFEDIGQGAFLMRLDGYILAVDPLTEPLTITLDGEYDVYVDAENASPRPLRTVSGALVISPLSALLLKKRADK